MDCPHGLGLGHLLKDFLIAIPLILLLIPLTFTYIRGKIIKQPKISKPWFK